MILSSHIRGTVSHKEGDRLNGGRNTLLTTATSDRVLPVLKWAGGKRWFVDGHSEYLDREFDRYIEPFAGGAAVFFHCQPTNAILADSNPDLIGTYEALKADWKKVYEKLRAHHRSHSDEYYYRVRSSKPRTLFTQAAKFIYLNRTCWNGLYRVNRLGQFNVPKGTKESVIMSTDNFPAVSQVLQNADLRCAGFEETIGEAGKGDLLFVDPPYTVRHNYNGFVKYNEKLFSWEDQEALHESVLDARYRGAIIVMTNANHPSIKKLYKDDFDIRVVRRYSAISSKSSSRSDFEELVIS